MGALFLFLFLMIGTPGPVVITLISGGLTLGFRRMLPFLAGILSGFAFEILLAGPPITFLFRKYPVSQFIFGGFGFLYTLYLAYRIIKAEPESTFYTGETQASVPKKTLQLGYMNGLILIMLNPKAYLITILTLSQFSNVFEGSEWLRLLKLMLSIVSVAFLCDLTWLAFASKARHWISSPHMMKTINKILSLLLVLVVSWALWKQLGTL